jgi:hypothetical protein
LAEDFLSDAYQQWQQHGSRALETMATSEPAKFCQVMANLLPKESVLQDERIQISEIKLVIVDANRTAENVLNSQPTNQLSDARADDGVVDSVAIDKTEKNRIKC